MSTREKQKTKSISPAPQTNKNTRIEPTRIESTKLSSVTSKYLWVIIAVIIIGLIYLIYKSFTTAAVKNGTDGVNGINGQNGLKGRPGGVSFIYKYIVATSDNFDSTQNIPILTFQPGSILISPNLNKVYITAATFDQMTIGGWLDSIGAVSNTVKADLIVYDDTNPTSNYIITQITSAFTLDTTNNAYFATLSSSTMVKVGIITDQNYVQVSFQRSGDTSSSVTSDPNTDGYDVFVVAGQSNSVGYGYNTTALGIPTQTEHPRIFQLGQFGIGLDSGGQPKIIPASDPLHHAENETWTVLRIGFAMTFLRDYAADNPTKKILVVPCGLGGSSFTAGIWNYPNGNGTANNYFGGYTTTVTRLQKAMSLGPSPSQNVLKGILWHQGESDSGYTKSAYTNAITPMIAGFRALRPEFASVPFVHGDLSTDTNISTSTGIRTALRDLQYNADTNVLGVKYCWMASTVGVIGGKTTSGGTADAPIHHDGPSCILLGHNYYGAYLKSLRNF